MRTLPLRPCTGFILHRVSAGLHPAGEPAHSLEISDDAATIKVPFTPEGADNYIMGAASFLPLKVLTAAFVSGKELVPAGYIACSS